ncbi:hypothetical protein ACFL04_04630 [Patescibacteria group bacterium]
MANLDTQTETKTKLSEKISLGFMVATGIIVVGSFLVAAGYIGINQLTGNEVSSTVVTPDTITSENDTNISTTANDSSASVLGETSDNTFTTE